jgi:ParB-like chromosome segregation protein Spo0J
MSDGLQIVYRQIEALTPYEKNSRTHSEEQVEQVARSISEFGFTNPILVDDAGLIIAGHGRLMAAIKLGLESVPTISLNHLSAEQRRAYVIADNKLAEQAGWDEDILAIEMAALQSIGFDLGVTGFNDKELADLLDTSDLPGLTGDDDVPEVVDSSTTRRLDIWKLGDHRLMCGDSTKLDQIRKLCDTDIDMVWTDPPYNVDYEGGNGQKIQNDNMSDSAFLLFLTDLFVAAEREAARAWP